MKTLKKIGGLLFAVAVLLMPTSCDKEYLNPASVVEEQVLGSVDGLVALSAGLQRRYSVGRQSPVYTTVTASGFTGFELRLINPGNTDEANLQEGKIKVDGNNAVVNQLWTQSMLIINEANKILDTLNSVNDAGYRSGLQSYATIFKSLALGNLATFFEQATITIGPAQPFVSREAALEEAVSLLEELNTVLAATPINPAFTAKVPAGLDVANTVNALLARYYTMLGNSDKALEAANKVDLAFARKSFFKYDAVSPNPISNVAVRTNNVFQPRNSQLGLPAELAPDPADKRLTFYLQSLIAEPLGKGFFSLDDASIPVFLPGEIILIKAEAYARKSQIPDAIVELNKILTKKPADDPWGIGADLSSYTGAVTQEAILTEIYRQRCIELFMSGLKLEDSRRFERPAPNQPGEERNRTFYPYPFSEKDNNPNTPDNPAI